MSTSCKNPINNFLSIITLSISFKQRNQKKSANNIDTNPEATALKIHNSTCNTLRTEKRTRAQCKSGVTSSIIFSKSQYTLKAS